MSLLCEYEPRYGVPAFTESVKEEGEAEEEGSVKKLKSYYRPPTNNPLQKEFLLLLRRGESGLENFLVQHSENIDIDAYDSEGRTPFHLSVSEGSLETVKLLVRYGANESLTTRDGFSPVHLAAYNGHSDILSYLLKRKRRSF